MNRDHLANERTFLAYLRTALAFVAFGFVVARFSLFVRAMTGATPVGPPGGHAAVALGSAMAILGSIIGVYGAVRYTRVYGAILAERDAPLRPAAAMFAGLALTAIGVAVAIVIVLVR